jgi:hypothetical protein
MSNEASPSTTTQPPTTLTIDDIRAMAAVIEACSARGAFKAEELSSVGMLYNKTVAFLKEATEAADAAAKQQPAQPAESIQ